MSVIKIITEKLRKKYVRISVILIPMTFLFWYAFDEFFYQPYKRDILRIQLETRKLEETKKILLEFKNRHKDTDNFFELVEENYNATKNYLPESLMQDIFVDEIYKNAEKNNLRVVSVQADENITEYKNSDQRTQKQKITVKFFADYVSTLNFIRQILDGNRLVNLSSCSIEKVDSAENLRCEINFFIYQKAAKNSHSDSQKQPID